MKKYITILTKLTKKQRECIKMSISNEIKKAMIDSNINGAKELSERSGISYQKIIRILNGDTSVRLKDAIDAAREVELEFKFIKKGE